MKDQQIIQNPENSKPKKEFTSIVGVSGRHKFTIQEGDWVLFNQLRCMVIARDFSSGRIQVEHSYWGVRWCTEDDVLLLKDLFGVGLIKQIGRFIISGEFARLMDVKKTDQEVKDLLTEREEKLIKDKKVDN